MSVPTADRAIVDAGLKSYSGEKGPPWVHGREDIEVVGVSDEHGKLKVGPKAERLRMGDKVMLIPGHCDGRSIFTTGTSRSERDPSRRCGRSPRAAPAVEHANETQ